MEKTIYTAPAAEVLEIATEGVLCYSSGNGTASNQKWSYQDATGVWNN